ncbi:MAG: Ig-like domain-containing protein [Myxococcota bacterium]
MDGARMWLAVALLAACNGEGKDGTGPTDTGGTDCVPQTEIPYDDIDQDCDGADLVDVDGDGAAAVQAGGDDCDDDDPGIGPAAAEIPYDGIDQDCEDGDLVDVDGDGHDGLPAGGDDCDDEASGTHPGATDPFGDDVDQDCDGADGVDFDQDGYASVASGGNDCADDDPARNPGATEVWYDGVDQDCDRQCDYDMDGDGAIPLDVDPGQITNGSPCDMAPGPEVYWPADCNDADPNASTAFFDHATPADGDVDVVPGTQIELFLGDVDNSMTISLVDAQGDPVPGAFRSSANYAVFEPDAALDWGATYTASFTYACGASQATFTVEPEPVPVDPAALIGNAYTLDLQAGQWTEPEFVWELFLFLLNEQLAVEVTGGAGDQVDLRFGSTAGGAQDVCVATGDTTATLAPNPDFVGDPVSVQTTAMGELLAMHDVVATGRFSGGGATLTHVSLDGLADTRNLGNALGLGGAPDAVCQFLAAFGIACEPCPDTGDATCTRFAVEELHGDAWAGSLVPRTVDDIDADPNCP